MQNSLGSGVIVTADGMVVTNTHVVKVGGAAEIKIALADRREFDAKVIQQDEKSDIAVLKSRAATAAFPFWSSRTPTPRGGRPVLAIGNPFGVGQTVTSGIISALARTEIGAPTRRCSSRPMPPSTPATPAARWSTWRARLVGINTAIFSRSGGSHGVGFAIPSNLVKLFVDSAVTGRKLERPWLGAKLDAVTREIAEALGLTRVAGALVTRLYDNGPAAEAGLQAGDVIVGVDGHEVADARSVLYRLTTRGIGQRAGSRSCARGGG